MATYALIKDGAFYNVVVAEADWTAPEGLVKELFDAAVHFHPPAPEPISRWIGSHRFLFTLHAFEQQVLMDAVHTAAMGLTPAQILNFDPGAVDGNGYPLAALRVFRLAYEMMDKLGGQVDLLSGNMDAFLQAASAIGLYGDTGEEIAAEIARIKSDTAPA